jgi:isoquinoline 1-oxidoreductase
MDKFKQKAGHFTTPPGDTDTFSSFTLPRRTFLQVLGSGILISVADPLALTQVSGATLPVTARILLNKDGTITALSGKVEEGQGPRAELSQAAAEELRVPVSQIRLVMADTDLVPDDGITAGSRTTPRNVPEMRQAAATARELLTQLAAAQWQVDSSKLEVHHGRIKNPGNGKTMTYADLAKSKDLAKAFTKNVDSDVALTPVAEWKVLGQTTRRPNSRNLVTGAHRYPSDIFRPNMLYGVVLRPPSFGATLTSIDLSGAEAMEGVVALRDGQFVGFAAPSTHRAEQALEAAAKSASWKTAANPVSNRDLHTHLKQHARTERARADDNRTRLLRW